MGSATRPDADCRRARRSSMKAGVAAVSARGAGADAHDAEGERVARRRRRRTSSIRRSRRSSRAAESGLEATPFVHTSAVQASPSTGLSLFSATDVTPPLPLQTAFWQLPVASGSAAVPASRRCSAQVWSPRQVRCRQIVSVPGQLVATRHCTQTRAAADPAAARRRAGRSVRPWSDATGSRSSTRRRCSRCRRRRAGRCRRGPR